MTEICLRKLVWEGNMANFCTNCGSKVEDYYNYCMNCGAKIDKSDIKQHNSSSNQYSDGIEKEKAKKELKRVVGGRLSYNKTFTKELLRNGLDVVHTANAIRQQVEKEIESGQIKSAGVEFRVTQLIQEYKTKNEEEKKKLKIIDEIFDSEEIKSEIRKNNIDQIHISSIKDSLKNKLINKRENMNEVEIRYFIKTELEKAIKEQEKAKSIKKEKPLLIKVKEKSNKEIEKNKVNHGGYCGLSCRHCYEEFLDSGGGIVGDFDSDGYVEYYCHLGHSVVYGRFCEDYE